jgi:hypothetical protein
MFNISKERLSLLKEMYTQGTRVELTHMNDPFTDLVHGDTGTVVSVDDIGTIHVKWDRGSSLGIVFGEDNCEII